MLSWTQWNLVKEVILNPHPHKFHLRNLMEALRVLLLVFPLSFANLKFQALFFSRNIKYIDFCFSLTWSTDIVNLVEGI